MFANNLWITLLVEREGERKRDKGRELSLVVERFLVLRLLLLILLVNLVNYILVLIKLKVAELSG